MAGPAVHAGGPYSVRQHADDLVRVLDALSLDAVTVCGMSLGGFVGVSLAVSHPERVRALICVDGGFPMAGREGLTPAMVPAAFAPTLAAVDREWPSVDEYVATHVNSLLSAEDPLLRNYAEHFLADGRVRLDKDAVIADATDVFFGAPRWQELAVPTRLVYAEWSVDRDSAPAYSPAAVSSFADSVEFAAPPRRVLGVDHGGIVMTAEGAEVVAEVLRETLAGR